MNNRTLIKLQTNYVSTVSITTVNLLLLPVNARHTCHENTDNLKIIMKPINHVGICLSTSLKILTMIRRMMKTMRAITVWEAVAA